MSVKARLMFAALCCVSLVFFACQEDKDIGLPEMFPQNATKLYFGDCEPFAPDQESTDLVYDAEDACTSPIEFLWFGTGTWYSNTFRVQPGIYYEGCHLVFTRELTLSEQAAVFHVAFSGLAVQFTERVEIPAGQTNVTADLFQQDTVKIPTDSYAKVMIKITDSTGYGRLNANYGNGSYVITGADQNTICRFAINLGLAQGVGHPEQGVPFFYENAVNEIMPTFAWDFTGGARIIDGPMLLFGPRYGAAYLTAQSGGCNDTASFWAPPGAQYRDDDLARLTDIEDYNRDYVSDGVTVWYWEVTSEEIDTTFIHLVRISYLTHWPFIEHPVCNAQYSTFAVLYDDANALIWILKDSPSTTDTAWGYTTGGILDTIVSLTNIAVDAIYHGQWLHNTSEDVFFRRAELIPFTGGSSTPIGPFPVELTRQFAGGAGVGYPGVANYNAWTINVFDTLGNWIARQPIPISGDEVVYGAKVLVAGRRVIYQVRSTNGLYIRALQPE